MSWVKVAYVIFRFFRVIPITSALPSRRASYTMPPVPRALSRVARYENYHVARDLVFAGPSSCRHLPYTHTRPKAGAPPHRQTPCSAQPELAVNPSTAAGGRSGSHAVRMHSSTHYLASRRNGLALPTNPKLAEDCLATRAQRSSLGTTVCPHDGVPHAHAYELGARGDAR